MKQIIIQLPDDRITEVQAIEVVKMFVKKKNEREKQMVVKTDSDQVIHVVAGEETERCKWFSVFSEDYISLKFHQAKKERINRSNCSVLSDPDFDPMLL